MIAELFKESRFQRGLEQGRKEGDQKIAAQQAAWEDWNCRREQAAAEGREFTEPPPTLEITRNGR